MYFRIVRCHTRGTKYGDGGGDGGHAPDLILISRRQTRVSRPTFRDFRSFHVPGWDYIFSYESLDARFVLSARLKFYCVFVSDERCLSRVRDPPVRVTTNVNWPHETEKLRRRSNVVFIRHRRTSVHNETNGLGGRANIWYSVNNRRE